jgi:hypothetical protein
LEGETDWLASVCAQTLGARMFAAAQRKLPALTPHGSIEHIQFPFKQWDGYIGPWSEHFGKGRGQVYSLDGTQPLRSCQEVEVAKLLRSIRDSAFWFSGYNVTKMPEIWRPWAGTLKNGPGWLSHLDAAIREQIRSPAGGMPDVVAWDEREPLRSAIFVECKAPRESFKEAQEDWVRAALNTGLYASQIAVAVRPF